ncbi:MAG: hypothetical protein ACI8VT_000903 [Saprospiraceae bacterium]|jgi:hypothetical protein
MLIMTKNPDILVFCTADLLELSMSISQFSDFKKNALSFNSCLKKLLKLSACEIWCRANSRGQHFLKIYTHNTKILSSSILDSKHPISIFPENKTFHITVIKNNDNGIYRKFTDLDKRIIYAFSLSNEIILLASHDISEIRIDNVSPEFQPNGLTSTEYLNQINQQIITEDKVNYDWVHQKNVGKIVVNIKRLIAGELTYFETEKQYIRKDGTLFWGKATRSKNPTVYSKCIIEQLMNIFDQKETEVETLQYSLEGILPELKNIENYPNAN